MTTKKKTRRRRSNTSTSSGKIYFGPKHEQAVIKYAQIVSFSEREALYRTVLEPVFDEMINKIVYTYKFNILPNIDDLKLECKSWLTTVLCKFDPEKGSRAFSYFSVIIKNWFIHKVKKNSDKLRRESYYDDVYQDQKNVEPHYEPDYDDNRENEDYINILYAEMIDWQDEEEIRPNDKKVIQAIMILLNNSEDIDIFNKKAIYLYLREITGLNSKQIASSLATLKQKYSLFRQDWLNEEF